jgi:Holliday junction DNA helicase RuvB
MPIHSSRRDAEEPPHERETVSPKLQPEDEGELSLRPKKLSEYIGQPSIKKNLTIALTAAKLRGEAMEHILLHGPPGLGKTSLAGVIANEMGSHFKSTSGPAIEKPGDLVAILSNLEEGMILFIDEIHRLNRLAEEFLYPAMEDYEMDMVIGQGPSARTIKIDLPRFTLIGATTRPGLLTNPLRDRFGLVQQFEFYSPDDLAAIVVRSAEILGVPIDDEGAIQIASRSRGTPRIANRLLKRARDWAQVLGDGKISGAAADAALKLQGVDGVGLDEQDRRFLRTLIEKFDGGPAGAETLAATLREERDTIEDVIEPFLMMLGFLNRTPRGRVATRLAYEHLGIPYRVRTDAEVLQPRLPET